MSAAISLISSRTESFLRKIENENLLKKLNKPPELTKLLLHQQIKETMKRINVYYNSKRIIYNHA